MVRIRILYFCLLNISFYTLNAMTAEEKVIELASQGILVGVQENNIEAIKGFLNKGGLPDKVSDEEGNTALMVELKKSNPNIEIIKLLLDAGASLGVKNNGGETPITIETTKKTSDHEILKLLILESASRGILISVQRKKTSVENVRDFLNKGGLPDKVSDEEGNTALMVELKKSNPNIEIIKLLLDAGASRDALNKKNERPLDIEIKKGVNANHEILKLLIDDEYYLHKYFAMMMSKENLDVNQLMSLVKLSNINQQDVLGNTLFFIVMPSTVKDIYNSFDLVRQLLQKGADPNIANKDGQTPLHRLFSLIPAIEKYQDAKVLKQIIQLLLDHNADIDLQPKLWRWKREKGKKPYKEFYSGNVKSPRQFLESLYRALKQSKIEKTPGQLALQIKLIEEIKPLMSLPFTESIIQLIESLNILQEYLKY